MESVELLTLNADRLKFFFSTILKSGFRSAFATTLLVVHPYLADSAILASVNFCEWMAYAASTMTWNVLKANKHICSVADPDPCF